MEILAKGIYKRFSAKWVIKDFNFEFHSGGNYGIKGANGSGKSTLMNLLFGSLTCSRGKIIYKKNNQSIDASAISNSFTFAAPYMNVYEHLNLDELLEFHLNFKSLIQGFDKEQFIEFCYLKEYRNAFISSYSSGMKQRLRLGLTLLTQSDVVFLDEPSSFLDIKAKSWYVELLRMAKKERTILIASNDIQDFVDLNTEIEL